MTKGSIAKKSLKNLLWGGVCQLIAIAFGVLIPRLVLVSYGSEVNGLLNSVVQIFSYFTLLEAGIGAVALQALYKSVATNNQESTNSILSAVNRYYRRIGLFYMSAVIVLSIIYPLIVNSSIPFLTVFLVIIFNGISPVANFLFQGKYNLLLQAEGKIYILNGINTTINILTSISKITLLSNGFDVVSVQFAVAIVSLFQMVYIGFYVHRHYQWINLCVTPDLKALSQSKNAFIHQVSGLIFFNTDAILLSIFIGLKSVSIYAMYSLLFGMIKTLMATVNSSVLFFLGQKFNIDKKDFLRLESIYETFYIGIIFLLYTIATIFIIPFMKLYTKGVDDANYQMNYLPTLFMITNILSYIRVPGVQIIGFAGHFQKTQNRAILEALIKLIISFALVNSMGIYGVLLGSIAALCYRTNDTLFYVAHRILRISVTSIYKKVFAYGTMTALIMIIANYLNPNLSDYINIVLYATLYTIGAIPLYLLAAFLCDRDVWNLLKTLFKKVKTRFS